jgi:hypothetical protein
MRKRPKPAVIVPTVNIQDVEYDARPETRVNNAGVPVKDPAKKDAREAGNQSDGSRQPKRSALRNILHRLIIRSR